MAKILSDIAVGDMLELPVLALCQAQFGGTIVFRIADNSYPGYIPGNVTLVGNQALQVLDSPYCSRDIYPLYNLPEDTLVSDAPNQSGNYELASEPVVIPVESVKIDGATIQSVRIRGTKQFTATITPVNATDKTLTWTSGNTNIFTVDNNGFVTGVGTGSSKLTVAVGGKSNFIMVQVTA